jgi:hypothetical protein
MKNPNELEAVITYARMHKARSSWAIKQDYLALRFLSRRLSTIDTQYCNGELTEEQETGKIAPVIKRLDATLKPYGLHWYHQSDPRGAALYVSKSPITQADYTSALCIY